MSSSSGSGPPKTAGKQNPKGAPRKANDVNAALRRAYESTLDENVPQSMLDLLNKLD